ncbi:regulator of microtubule dynamics protein 2 isoform X5 [Mastomys coucha]|uniref:regulator of microtubule dynamics protein 2 isoform X5 n=1 Tax=Mastomys coucha TaxID=35658 RepID=UPI00126144FA|nr:regulator of microtubule dynamics protein 2 isoform X5 [Mastomys coucha]XP_031211136.1 regulator of microtubule dynamics protein 2 isoform X5 [Mastomys coucha]XP_031211137.1 regulator of microtubule dynamics protein 2 isoform X5 [Mastomys coucha]XP_031211138.1 regulator of microtubule dynamics protein 2 isoform X5 [Mastomys coucha]
MPHSTHKELILGIMVATTGISLLVLWYHKILKPRTSMNFPRLLSLGKKFDSVSLPDESHSEHGASVVFRRRQLQILEKLNELLSNMEELKEEIKFLKETIPKLEECIQDELGGKITVHKISPQHRARKKKVTTVQRPATSNSSEEAESEGGYITANTDTEEQSFPDPQALNTHIEELKLDVLLQKVDHLRINESNKMESFELLCDHKEKFSEEIEFLWRLARAYGDMYDLSTNTQEKKHYANVGKTLGERAITRAPMNGHCHLWYAVLCGYVSEFEGLQNKINCGYLFKKHLDIAIQLLPEEPLLYYLKGRYCYTVSKLSWIEKKMASTLFGEIPSSTVHEALYNFLKAIHCSPVRLRLSHRHSHTCTQPCYPLVCSLFIQTEELQPGYSVSNYMYASKCYVELGESQEAWKFCNLALLLPIVTKEDKDAHKEVKKIIDSLKRRKANKKNHKTTEKVK